MKVFCYLYRLLEAGNYLPFQLSFLHLCLHTLYINKSEHESGEGSYSKNIIFAHLITNELKVLKRFNRNKTKEEGKKAFTEIDGGHFVNSI